MATKPYIKSDKGKKDQVREMFDNIAPTYDLLNHLLSFGIDKIWRKKLRKILASHFHEEDKKLILDIATGTGDLAIECAKIPNASIHGIDISKEMLSIARVKSNRLKLHKTITYELGDAESLSKIGVNFDAAMVAFGVRNFENLNLGLSEIAKVLKPGAIFLVLEFSDPRNFPFKQMYWLYFRYMLPVIGKIISKDYSAYAYLPESVKKFPRKQDFIELLKQTGFRDTTYKTLTFGIATIYKGIK